ncbi:putative ankyrin-3-like isoform X2, partial [Diplonema papillatum]
MVFLRLSNSVLQASSLQVVKDTPTSSNLLQRGARVAVDSTNVSGETALVLASTEGHVTVVQELLEAGASVNAADNNGYTALIVASMGGYASVVKELLYGPTPLSDERRPMR